MKSLRRVIVFYKMAGLIVKKSGMSQIISDNGEVSSVTLLKVDSNVVTQIKTKEKDGYSAIQIGSGARKKYNKPTKGHLKELDAKIFKEIIVDDVSKYKVGDKIDVSILEVGDKITITGTSKGKGFAGTIKRHNFKSGPGSHGHDHHRQPGSIGAMGMPRVHKGKRMAGRMGGDTITRKKVLVMATNVKDQTIAIKGPAPGANKEWLLIKKA